MARGGEQIPTPGGRRIKYFAGGIFSPGALEGSDFDVSTFFNDKKTAFCEYWTSIKITISMAYVSKEYEI